jgi:hypothetical protein
MSLRNAIQLTKMLNLLCHDLVEEFSSCKSRKGHQDKERIMEKCKLDLTNQPWGEVTAFYLCDDNNFHLG